MTYPLNSLALYTTIYPGVEPYLQAWYRSVSEQTDHAYQLWIGLDALEVAAVVEALGGEPQATWVIAAPGETPAQIRQRAFTQIVEASDGVVLVDSDDVLHPSRVAAARVALETSDLNGCALRLVDQHAQALSLTFTLPPALAPDTVLPRNNIFGLSNTAFRSSLLRRCLPIPAEVALVDWFLATRAWLYGARLSFDSVARMDYRQHANNLVGLRYPFSAQQVIQETERVRCHFRSLYSALKGGYTGARWAELEQVTVDTEAFYQQIVLTPSRLEAYLQALNALKPAPVWWTCVAHPALRHLWASQ